MISKQRVVEGGVSGVFEFTCVTQNIGMNMLTSRVHDAWYLDVADRHCGQVIMMKMYVESRQTNSVLSSQPKRKHVCFSMWMNVYANQYNVSKYQQSKV